MAYSHSPEWMDRGRCLGDDPEEWFPESWNDDSHALRICAECPVKRQCLEYAMTQAIPDGIWGGIAPAGRARMRLEARRG